jgi:hypothetical protein
MYAIVYRVDSRRSLRMWSKVFNDKDSAELERKRLTLEWQSWMIFFEDPRKE